MSMIQDADVPNPPGTSRGRARSDPGRAGHAPAATDADGPTAAPAAPEGPEGPGPDGERIDTDGADAALLAGVAAAGEMDRAAGIHVAPEYPLEDLPPEIDVDTILDADGRPLAQVGAAERLDRLAALPDQPSPLEVPASHLRSATDFGEDDVDREADLDDADELYEAVLDEAVLDEPTLIDEDAGSPVGVRRTRG